MLPRSRFLKVLREYGYTYKKETKRTDLYRKKGSRMYVAVPKNAELEEEFVRWVLQREGCSPEQIVHVLQEG